MKEAAVALLCASLALAGCGSGGPATATGEGTATKERAPSGQDGTAAGTPDKAHAQAIAADYTLAQMSGAWKALATEEEKQQARREGLDIDSSQPVLTLGKDGSFVYSDPEGQMSGSYSVSGSTLSLRVETSFGEKVDPNVYRAPVFEVAEKGKSLLSPPGPDGHRLEFRRK